MLVFLWKQLKLKLAAWNTVSVKNLSISFVKHMGIRTQ